MPLSERLEIEKTTFHWLPYKKILVHQLSDGTDEETCWNRSRAIEEFPDGWWTRKYVFLFSSLSRFSRINSKFADTLINEN